MQVAKIEDTTKEARIYVTTTGCKGILRPEHFENMLEDTIVCNIGHFDCEIDVAWLNANCAKKEQIQPQVSNIPKCRKSCFNIYLWIFLFVLSRFSKISMFGTAGFTPRTYLSSSFFVGFSPFQILWKSSLFFSPNLKIT